jgi:hypothetical protein
MFRKTLRNRSIRLCDIQSTWSYSRATEQFPPHRRLCSLASPLNLAGFPNNPKLPRPHSRNISSMATSDPKTPASLNAAPTAADHPALSKVEASKRRAAYRAVEDHFDPSYRYIGIGSGSTVVYVVEAIAAKGRNVTSKMIFIPTGTNPHATLLQCKTNS